MKKKEITITVPVIGYNLWLKLVCLIKGHRWEVGILQYVPAVRDNLFVTNIWHTDSEIEAEQADNGGGPIWIPCKRCGARNYDWRNDKRRKDGNDAN